MVRSLRRGLLTAAAVWAASAVAGNEQDSHESDNKWLASTVTVTSTAYVDLENYEHRCVQGHYACGATTTPFPEQKNCVKCQNGGQTAAGSWNTAASAYNKDAASYSKNPGSYNKESGSYNKDAGSYDTATGEWNKAAGDHTKSSGAYHTATGTWNKAAGDHTKSSGAYHTATGEWNKAAGSHTKSSGAYHTATGTWDEDPSSEHEESGAWNKVPENSDSKDSKDSNSSSWSQDASAWNRTWGNWHTDPTDVNHGLWAGCGATEQHCPTDCNCSSKSICETAEGPQCKSSTECKSGEMCNSNGVCQPIPGPRCQGTACEADNGGNCTTNSDCEHGQICNQRGHCQQVVFPDCEKNSDCKWGEICTSWGICKTADSPACQNDKGCNEDHLCNSQRICQKAECPKCKIDTECESGEGCFEGSCKSKQNNKCSDAGQCGDGEICDSEGRCRRGDHFRCKVDSECKLDDLCDVHGLCQKRAVGLFCGSDRQCQNTEFCNAFGHCENKPFDRCENDSLCLPGELCSNRRCAPRLGCRFDGDCRGGELCEGSICVNKAGCRHDFECGQEDSCTNGRCERKLDTCVTGQGICRDGKVCSGTQCLECTPNVTLTGKRAPAAIRSCPTGFDCLLGRCVEGTQQSAPCTTNGQLCQLDRVCSSNACVTCSNLITARNCPTGFDCLLGRCVGGTLQSAPCTTNGQLCQLNRVCSNNACVACSNLITARNCPTGYQCLADICLPLGLGAPPVNDPGNDNGLGNCVNGLQWAYYKLTRAVRNTVTIAGTIPLRTADADTAQNWPILNFQPNVALNGQSPRFSGLTQTLGIQRTCPPEHAIIYGTDAGTGIDYSIVQHIGYFRPKTAGTYTFQVGPGLRQTVYVWLGENARAGWKNLNANLIADGSSTAGLNAWLRVVSAREVGQFIPIRVLYVNAQDCGEFNLQVSGPNNAVLVNRDLASDDGEFLSNCGASALIPSIGFAPIFDVDLGLGLGNDDLEIGIGSNLGSLGINAGLNVGDTGNVGQDVGGNLAGLGVALGSGDIGANQNGNLLNLTAGGNGLGVNVNGSGLGLGGLGVTLGNGGVDQNGNLLNLTAGGNGVGLGLNGSALSGILPDLNVTLGNGAGLQQLGNLLNLTAGGNGVGVGVNGSGLGLGGLNLTLPIPV